MILNLITSKEIDALDMMKRSFYMNNKYFNMPENLDKLNRLKADYVKFSFIECPYVLRNEAVDNAPIYKFID